MFSYPDDESIFLKKPLEKILEETTEIMRETGSTIYKTNIEPIGPDNQYRAFILYEKIP